jgi:hypothetical protein
LGERGTKRVEFFKKTLELRMSRTTEGSEPERGELFSPLDNAVGFRRSTGLYLLGAVLFSIAYVGVATFGSWGFLRSRRWTQHAWSAFGVVAGLAAVLSLLAAQSMRGVGRSLHQLTIVDAWAGDTDATATVYFGVKTGTHSLLDVWMPSTYVPDAEPEPSNCFLKPMPSSASVLSPGSSYADPTRYDLKPATGELHAVPVRATLKQFEGRWSGQLPRTIRANIRVGELYDDDGEHSSKGVRGGSTITNDLNHDLTNCFIIQPLRDPYARKALAHYLARDDWIYVFPIGDIAAGEQIDLADRMYVDRKQPTGVMMDVETWEKWTLGENVKNWHRGLRGADLSLRGGSDVVPDQTQETYQDALLLATALTEHDPQNLQGAFGTGFDYSRRHCRQLDRSTELTADVIMLVGFAEDQGPVTLCARSSGRSEYRPLLPDRAYTMYRFVIPVGGR